jgi:heme-degrading monooxygenase HmoA
MTRIGWNAGAFADWPGPFYVSTTRFTYRAMRTMPAVFWNGWQLRRAWDRNDGAVGLSMMVGLRERTTYTISVWRSKNDLERWLRSPAHSRLMRAFRSNLESHAADSWTADSFDLRAAWREALKRVAA